MSSQRTRAVSCVLVLLVMSLSPLVTPAAASDAVLLSSNTAHVVLVPGQSTNVTLTVENNGSSITSYNVTVDTSSLASVWNVTNADETVDNVFPTWSKNTTVVVRLLEGATVADSGSFTVTMTDVNTNATDSQEIQVTVAPSYHPSLSATSPGAVNMAAGQSLNLTYTAANLGSVTDTYLLDVEVEPDLTGWWANQTNASSNNSGGNTTSAPSLSVLMYGNSYTASNSLGSLVETVMDADGYNSSVSALTGGGMRLPQHWQNLNSSGHQWNATLRTGPWDYVVLQDQSQVPSFPTTESMWLESRNATVNLSSAIEDEGGETVLFVTWGYRDGDSLNTFNNNFTTMQARLLEGYTRYAENISNAGNTVWLAPVGLAFKTVHDAVVADGDDPTASGNLFYDLYSSDGSHPSLAGSYLAACVMHASLNGDSCAGITDGTGLSASTKLALQQAADDTVFNQTSGMSYYPWEVSGTAAFGLGGSVPSGWYLQWEDDEVSQLPAGDEQSVTLSVTVPSDAAPDYYGYRLTIGSTNGNVTSSTLLVVKVAAEPALSMAFLQQDDLFLPGQSTATTVQVTNTGNTVLDLDWSVTAEANAPCTVAMIDAQTSGLALQSVADVGLNIDVDETADGSDECAVTMVAHHQVNDATEVLQSLAFVVAIDEAVNFSMSGPAASVEMVPSEGANYELRLHNHGSDAATFFLDIQPTLGLQTVMVTASAVHVDAGSTGVWTVNTQGDEGLAGSFVQSFSTTYNGQTASVDVEVVLEEVASFTVTAAAEDRVLLSPGESAYLNATVSNTGTSNLSLSAVLSGLPAGVTAQFSESTVTVNRSSSQVLSVLLQAATGAEPSTTALTLTLQDGSVSDAITVDLILLDRTEVVVNSVQTRLLAAPTETTTMIVDVTNVGTQTDVYVVEWSSESNGYWYEFTVTPTTFQLGAGETQSVSIGVREVSQGAPEQGVEYTFAASSTSDASSSDTVVVTVESVVANVNLTVLDDKSSAKPGASVYGSIILTNTGNTEDTFSVTSVGTDCGLDTSVTLAPGLSSSPLGWSCIVPNDAAAGERGVVFRAVSAVRSNVAVEKAVFYTVEADYPGSSLVALAFEQSTLTLGVDSSSSAVLSVTNLANAEVVGTLEVLGEETGVLILEWTRLSDQVSTNGFTLAPGSTVEFKLTVISNTARSATAEVVVRSTATGAGVTTSDQAVPLMVTVEGPALPPNGLSLPFGLTVSQSTTLAVMGVGWLVAVLAVLRLRGRVPVGPEEDKSFDATEEVAEEDEEDESLPELGYNECRLDGESKVNCPTCEARLGVPRGSVPPFRFTCPQCNNKIRVVE